MRHEHSRRTRSVVSATVAAIALALVLPPGTGTAAAKPRKASQAITVGAEEFPPTLNDLTPEGNGFWTAMVVGPALARGYKILPDFSYQPWLFAHDCTIAVPQPFTVDCQVRSDAKWSDGAALTAEDFKFTYETIMNPKNNIVSRDGYDQITAFNVISPTDFQMVFKDVFAPFRDLWAGTSTTVLPEHVLLGADFNTVWNRCICDPKTKKPIASGPMLVQSFTPNRQVTLVPNPNYWAKKASVPKVVFVPSLDSNSEVNAFRAGEVDMIYPQNQIGLKAKIDAVRGASYQSSLGPVWEHFDMLTTVPGLDDVNVRKAIATALPRQAIVDRVVKDANAKATVLENTIFMANQADYQANWSMYPASGDVDTAKKMLDDAGWKPGDDGVRQKNGVRLAFTLGTTSGNQARELAEQIIKQQLDQIGVRITIKNAPDYLDVNLTGFDYQTIMFAWAGSPDPYQNNVIFQSTSIPKQCSKKAAKAGTCDESGENYTKMHDPVVDSLLAATNKNTDAKARAALFNQADRRMATDDVTVVPLFQKPTQLAYRSTIGGVVDNPTIDGFTWNIEDWTYAP